MSKDLTDAQMLEALVRKVKSETRIIGDFEIKTRTGRLDGKQTTEPYIVEYLGVDRQFVREISWQVFLYHKGAARALFGDSETPPELIHKFNTVLGHADEYYYVGSLMQYHLQQAVISPNPIKYMYESVFSN